jgi:Protein of unknown function (DUF3363)
VILDPERPPTAPVIGRVYGRGAVDELSDQRYLLVEAQEGQAYYVPLSASSERAGESARVGAIVRIVPAVRRPTGAAHRSLASPSATQTMGPGGGSVIKVERLAATDLELQVQANGVTWLDQELARAANLNGVGRVGATRFERELAMALKDRAQHLETLGLAQEFDGGMQLKSRFLDALYERELEDAAARLRTQYGELTRLEPGLTLKGRATALETLPSGPHVVVAGDSHFALVPARSGIGRSLTKTVALTVGRARAFNPTQPMTPQLVLRYRELVLGRALRR